MFQLSISCKVLPRESPSFGGTHLFGRRWQWRRPSWCLVFQRHLEGKIAGSARPTMSQWCAVSLWWCSTAEPACHLICCRTEDPHNALVSVPCYWGYFCCFPLQKDVLAAIKSVLVKHLLPVQNLLAQWRSITFQCCIHVQKSFL